jgi:hypothetical protein
MKVYNPHKSAEQQGAVAYLFDAGATVHAGGGDRSTTAWLFDRYEKLGIVFDQVHAWEKSLQAVDVSGLKPALAKAIHVHTEVVSSGTSDAHNPLVRIRELCKPKDVVVFKLDTDGAVDSVIAQQLLDDAHLLDLVDEFYYGGVKTDLKSWYELVLPARQKGLHMHMWP